MRRVLEASPWKPALAQIVRLTNEAHRGDQCGPHCRSPGVILRGQHFSGRPQRGDLVPGPEERKKLGSELSFWARMGEPDPSFFELGKPGMDLDPTQLF